MKFYFLFFLVLGGTYTFAQEYKGKVINANTNEVVPFASVYFIDLEIGSITDEDGVFIIKGDFPDSSLIRIRAIGYEDLYHQKSGNNPVFGLTATHLDLPEVTVSSPLSRIQKDNVVFIDARKIEDLNVIPGSLGENLSNIPGVYQSSTGQGISKPVIRGMQGTRVVTMLNGLRIESQQWGGDHGNTFTALGIGSVEVIKGPASLMFGADALGGTIYFVDQPGIAQNNQKITIESQYESVTNGAVTSGTYQVSKKNWRLSAAGLYSNNADYQLPSGDYALNSRFSESGAKLAFGYSRNKWLMNIRYAYANNQIGLPGHTHDSIIDPLSFQVEKQERRKLIPQQVNSNHLFSMEHKWFGKQSKVSLLVGNTLNNLKEYEEKVTIPALNMLLNNSLYHLKWTWSRGDSKSVKIVSGLQGGYQVNMNGKAWEEHLLPDFNQSDNGVYSLLSIGKGRLNSMVGFRYDVRNLNVMNSELGGSFSRLYQSVNGSVGLVYSDTTNTIRLNASSGFRSPHVSELTAFGEHHGVLRFEMGDLNLKSERATQVDVTYELSKEHVELILNPFYNYIQNYITATPQDSIIDGLPLFQYEQIPVAHLYGGDVGIHYHPHFAHWVHLESSYSHLVSDDGNGGYLPLIPQNRVSTSLRFLLEKLQVKKFKVKELSVQHRYFSEQNLVSGMETSSPDYHLVNVGMTMQFDLKTPLDISIGCKNLLNENYIDHLSRLKNIELQHPGRSFYVKASWQLNFKTNNNNKHES